jgi:transcriptional regulator with XRE-family HTH domain
MDELHLAQLRERMSLSQQELGELLHLSQSQISRALKGMHKLNEDASRLALALADDFAPDIAAEARLWKRTESALRNSAEFRQLVAAALTIMRNSA